MTHMINRCALFVVFALSVLLLGGCAGIFQTPREQANEAIADANESIATHNDLFEQARDTYTGVKARIESGDDPSAEERQSITEAKTTLEEARANLDDARESVGTVQNLDVDPKIKDYASLLSKAMDDQLAAEAKEIQFYDLLEEDPALENNRERATDLLSEIGAGYQEAEKTYSEAQELANSNPKLIESAPEGGG
jgi:CHASE3 domain sensor protein